MLMLSALYGSTEKDLDSLRHTKTTLKQQVHAQFNLAPLSSILATARQQSLRVFHQLQQWCGIDMDPLQWG